MEQAELERIIEQARLDRVSELDLTWNGLTSLSESIGNLSNLNKLYLGGNKLTSLPKSIGNLTNLTRLHLRDNRLTSLPECIGTLSNLTRLDLQHNQLSSLPGSICQLSRLKHLSLDETLLVNSSISRIFSTFHKLPNLKNVYFSYIGLHSRYLNDFGEWKAEWLLDEPNCHIRHILIEQMGWEKILEGLGNISGLTDLDLQDNKITELPENLSNLSELIRLNINDNPLTDLSPLQSISHLEEVYFLEIYLPRRYWTRFSIWKPEWLLDEENAEIRRVLIEQVGYEKICDELGAIAIDTWREYTLLKIDNIQIVYEDWQEVGREPMVLLKMTCPSTGHIHILRVPPEMTSAEAAITWVNHGIHPDKFAVQT